MLTAAALCAPAARAQSLQRLTVQTFTLGSDVGRPQAGTPFHLVVTLYVRENVAQIANLELPMLAELELLGDERVVRADSRGTTYRETIAVLAHRAGTIVVAPAILAAIDARDGRAKQYYSNGLTLQIGAAPGQGIADGVAVAASVGRFAVQVTIWVLGGLCAIALIVLVFRRRPAVRAALAPAPEPLVPPLARERSPRERLRDALTVLRAEPTRGTAVRARAAVWNALGASEGVTLADVLARTQATEPSLRGVLVALERAAFTYDADLRPAIDDACDALQRYLTT
ncbi:MAG TPA: hypothetical protein VGF86_15645 [Candidatus Tumulicola sp.]